MTLPEHYSSGLGKSCLKKGRSAVLLECARLEEFVGDMDLARAILCKARRDSALDWKIWLESVNLEIRCEMPCRASAIACEALETHTGTGRLWAALVQLRHREGERVQSLALKQSLRAVPKSGEVWGEAARIHLNPFSPLFDIQDVTTSLPPRFLLCLFVFGCRCERWRTGTRWLRCGGGGLRVGRRPGGEGEGMESCERMPPRCSVAWGRLVPHGND